MMSSARLMRRLPARESRCRCWLPEDASSGAVPFQDANRSRSARRWISPTSASNRAALDGPMPVSSSTVEPRSVTRVVSCFLIALILRSIVSSSPINSTTSRRRVLPGRSRGLIVAISARACCAERNCLAPPGNSSNSSRCNRFTVWMGARPSSSRRSASMPITTRSSSTSTRTRFGVRSATIATECASTGSVLRPLPGANTRTCADSFAGTSSTVSPSCTSRWAMCLPIPLQPSIAHTRSGKRRPSASMSR